MSEVTTQAKPERRKRQKLEDMEGYKPLFMVLLVMS